MSIGIQDRTSHLRQIEDSVRAELMKRYSSVFYDLAMVLFSASVKLGPTGDSNPEFVDRLKRELYVALTSGEKLPYEFDDYFWAQASHEVDYYSEEVAEMGQKIKRHFESIIAQGMEV